MKTTRIGLLILSVLLCIALGVAFTACDSGDKPTDTTVGDPATDPITDAPTEEATDAPTEAPTDAPATDAPTEPAEGGCGSVIGFSAIAVLAAAAAAVALKKKD